MLVSTSTACSGGAPAATEPALELGWATTVVQEPGSFSALMERTNRDAWIAYFEHRYLDAADALPPGSVGVNRAIRAEVTLHRDLQTSVGLATSALFEAWEQRGSLPPGQGPALVASLGSICSNQPGTTSASLIPVGSELPLPAANAEGPLAWPEPSATLPDSLREAVDLHRGSTTLAGVRALQKWAASDGTLIVDEAGSDSVARTWVDPCVHRSIADGLKAAQATAPAAAPGDLESSLFGANEALEQALGLSMDTPTVDDADAAREDVRAMDLKLDAMRERLASTANEDGRALLDQLDPLHRLRQEVLVQRARRDLRAGLTERGLATLMLARDVTDNAVGPRNSPALLALLTEANLRSGRVRQGLDALQPLVAVRPEVAPLREILSDLVVLRGLDRRGDSKEH
ncbi:MAG: hypothetical protein AB8H79_22110 [Myxococcota bacterium]